MKVRWGRLFLERFQPADAEALFQEALEIEPKNAAAVLGLALVAAETFDRRAVELAEQAAQLDPKLTEGYELLARLALEEGDFERASKEAGRAGSFTIPGIITLLNDGPPEARFDAPAYAEAGRQFVLNRRYEEAVELFRKALALNPRLWAAHSDLGVQLMRLGLEKEAREHLERAYNSGYKSPAVVNSLRLLDSYANFDLIREGGIVLKLHKKESALLRPYVEAELRRAIQTYQRKYRFQLERPVQVELYPDHEDFAVRTLGMPGLGALGVSFGYVVAMDSPSGRKPGSFHWASTLWHELSHVYVLAMTRHRVPRWFTEGLAVHEETAVSPEWGDRLSPDVLLALKGRKLLPIETLDRSFVRPSYPAQVVVSYFQAGRTCDYIAEKWGFAKLIEMVGDFGRKKSTPQVIEERLGLKPEEFDKQFLAWLEPKTKKTVEGFDAWRKGIQQLQETLTEKKFDLVLSQAPALRDLYPDYVEAGSAYEALAEAHLALKDKPKAMAALEAYARAGGRDPHVLKQLAAWQEETGRKTDAAATLDRLNFITPTGDEQLHRKLGELYLETADAEKAIREFSAALASQPGDLAAAHFNLARAYRAANRLEQAKEQVVLALEAAPGYRAAQKLLLELSK
ncbi:MAG: tetratricopeptide repeat protein [Acidobacteria bacterium]|nr:tetratricopeptide repeat protein [Acidobacteriota bacterium]